LNKNLLVINHLNFNLKILEKHKITHILALGFDKYQVTDYIGSLFENKIQVIDLNHYRGLAETEVRKYVIETVSTLPKFKSTKTDLSKLLFNKSGINLWWFLEISEKSPFRGAYISQLYQLACIQLVKQSSNFDQTHYRLSDYNILSILLSDQKVYIVHSIYHLRKIVRNLGELKYFLNSVFILCKIILIKIILANLQKKDRYAMQSHGVFSFYPSWWLKPYTKENSDRFFSRLVKDDGVFLNYIWLSENFFETIKSVKKIRWLGQKSENIIIQKFFRYRDIKKISSFRTWLQLRNFRNQIIFSNIPSFMNLDVRPILNQELSRNISSQDLVQSQIIQVSMTNTLHLAPPKSLLFRFESQPLDRSLIYSCKNLTISVGYSHSSLALCENYLSFWFGKEFLKENYASLSPDKVIYSNKFSKRALIREGFPESKLLHCGPLRSSELMQYRNPQKMQSSKESFVTADSINIFIGMSVNTSINEIMIKNLISVLEETCRYKLIIKTHPSLELLDLNLFHNVKRNANLIILNKNDEYLEFLGACDFSVMTGTTLVFESIYLKTFPIVYESASIYNAVNFQQFRKFCLIAFDRSQLLNATKMIRDNSSEVISIKENWPELIEKNYGSDVNEVDRHQFVINLESLIARTAQNKAK
jgi:hypothetical protein